MNDDWRKAIIVENKSIARGSNWITLRAVDSYPVIYEPGNVISLGIPNQYGEMVTHPYTISVSDHQQSTFGHLYRIIPDGRFTPVLSRLKPGQTINFRGNFHTPIEKEISEDADAMVGIATGAGIGPLYGFSKKILAAGIVTAPITIFAGFREHSDICLLDELEELRRDYSNFNYAITLTNPPEGWQGLRGRVTESVPPLIGNLKNVHFHLVGNGNMIGEMVAALGKAGVPKHRISTESYFNHKGKLSPEPEIVSEIAERFNQKIAI
jgi:NAD(P)H-flavin reductase